MFFVTFFLSGELLWQTSSDHHRRLRGVCFVLKKKKVGSEATVRRDEMLKFRQVTVSVSASVNSLQLFFSIFKILFRYYFAYQQY